VRPLSREPEFGSEDAIVGVIASGLTAIGAMVSNVSKDPLRRKRKLRGRR
jgi:hypothetical protein